MIHAMAPKEPRPVEERYTPGEVVVSTPWGNAYYGESDETERVMRVAMGTRNSGFGCKAAILRNLSRGGLGFLMPTAFLLMLVRGFRPKMT